MSDLLLMILAIIIAFVLVGIVLRLLKGVIKVVIIVVIAILVFGFLAGVNFTDIGDKDKPSEENQTYVNRTLEEVEGITGTITGMVTKVANPNWWEAKLKRKAGERLIESADSKTITIE